MRVDGLYIGGRAAVRLAFLAARRSRARAAAPPTSPARTLAPRPRRQRRGTASGGMAGSLDRAVPAAPILPGRPEAAARTQRGSAARAAPARGTSGVRPAARAELRRRRERRRSGGTSSGGRGGRGGSSAGGSGGSGNEVTCDLPTKFKWTSSGIVVAPKANASHAIVSVKDPTIVFLRRSVSGLRDDREHRRAPGTWCISASRTSRRRRTRRSTTWTRRPVSPVITARPTVSTSRPDEPLVPHPAVAATSVLDQR